MIDLSAISIKEARESLKNGEFSARELAEAALKTIEEKDPEIRAFLEVYDDVLSQADLADKKIKAGEDTPLLGIPVAIKDNMLLDGKRATAGSKILVGFIAPYNSTAVRKLLDAGAVIVGRTNMDEFAMGSSTENSAFGPTRNPSDTSRVPGGSSGGSAAAVAAGMVLGSLGSDTGGSIRQPAAHTGIVGMKPTYGRVSRSGLIAMASSLDQIGPLGKTILDAETLYEVIRGQDPMDSTTLPEGAYGEEKGFSKTIGVPREFVEAEGMDPAVKNNFGRVIEKFKSLGYKIKDIKTPSLPYALAVYYILMPAEVSSNLARFDGVKYGLRVEGENLLEEYLQTRGEGFGIEARRRILLGTYVLSSGYYDAYYGQALSAKRMITAELRKAFKDVDLMLTPTTAAPAFKIGEKTADPLSMYLEDLFTVPANIAGLPSISVPAGNVETDGKNLPVGILLTADLGKEDYLFRAGKEFSGEAL